MPRRRHQPRVQPNQRRRSPSYDSEEIVVATPHLTEYLAEPDTQKAEAAGPSRAQDSESALSSPPADLLDEQSTPAMQDSSDEETEPSEGTERDMLKLRINLHQLMKYALRDGDDQGDGPTIELSTRAPGQKIEIMKTTRPRDAEAVSSILRDFLEVRRILLELWCPTVEMHKDIRDCVMFLIKGLLHRLLPAYQFGYVAGRGWLNDEAKPFLASETVLEAVRRASADLGFQMSTWSDRDQEWGCGKDMQIMAFTAERGLADS